jgi:hypothetical protein
MHPIFGKDWPRLWIDRATEVSPLLVHGNARLNRKIIQDGEHTPKIQHQSTLAGFEGVFDLDVETGCLHVWLPFVEHG